MPITSFRQDLIEWDSRNKGVLPNKIRKIREKWERQCIKEEWIIFEEINRIEKFKLRENFYQK